ncbi:putative sensor domain DACNV-containing protein [Mesorhizobium sp. WSM4904]|uniref:putative sensor domain DACNV-containing protein n=1 Tax=Mesorhizobium sp. WSM4904 TaxID=3038545 RepID=UPI0024181518|nr:hypothetical protein [Mesorhizobium sp. WSM4904]WFP61314.1 hypothetical protein QAZ47_22855 [Mesorhizobium sp. WSM4904]
MIIVSESWRMGMALSYMDSPNDNQRSPPLQHSCNKLEISVAAFPKDLADVVFKRWPHMVGGDYVTPPCPPLQLLEQLLDVSYLTASAPEEARYPSFNIVALAENSTKTPSPVGPVYEFASSRPLSVGELRRLAPATDSKKSAILAFWNEQEWSIAGLIDLGTSWHRARTGLEYRYRDPRGLFVQVDRPGRLRVYQGGFLVATLTDGVIETGRMDYNVFLHEPANAGLGRMSEEIDYPEYEHPREYRDFEFIAMWNTYAAIANAISLAGHGGMLIIKAGDTKIDPGIIKIKYETDAGTLRASFIDFMNRRNVLGDYESLDEDGHLVPEGALYKAVGEMKDSYESLVEATRFVAGLSGCDGSIVISDDLRLLGFGAEIRAEIRQDINIFEVNDEFRRKYKRCDIEQFGMRHRSAVKLASRDYDCRILVVSQDGPISAVWWEKDRVLVKKGVHLVNMNIPWA